MDIETGRPDWHDNQLIIISVFGILHDLTIDDLMLVTTAIGVVVSMLRFCARCLVYTA